MRIHIQPYSLYGYDPIYFLPQDYQTVTVDPLLSRFTAHFAMEHTLEAKRQLSDHTRRADIAKSIVGGHVNQYSGIDDLVMDVLELLEGVVGLSERKNSLLDPSGESFNPLTLTHYVAPA